MREGEREGVRKIEAERETQRDRVTERERKKERERGRERKEVIMWELISCSGASVLGGSSRGITRDFPGEKLLAAICPPLY